MVVVIGVVAVWRVPTSRGFLRWQLMEATLRLYVVGVGFRWVQLSLLILYLRVRLLISDKLQHMLGRVA